MTTQVISTVIASWGPGGEEGVEGKKGGRREKRGGGERKEGEGKKRRVRVNRGDDY